MADRPGVDRIELELSNQLTELNRIAAAVEDLAGRHRLPDTLAYHLNLSLDELFTNIVSYGYDDGGTHCIRLALTVDGGMLECVLRDDGKPFNPLDRPEPDLNLPADQRPIGGLGIFLVKKAMDEVAYRREGSENVLTLRKRLAAANG